MSSVSGGGAKDRLSAARGQIRHFSTQVSNSGVKTRQGVAWSKSIVYSQEAAGQEAKRDISTGHCRVEVPGRFLNDMFAWKKA